MEEEDPCQARRTGPGHAGEVAGTGTADVVAAADGGEEEVRSHSAATALVQRRVQPEWTNRLLLVVGRPGALDGAALLLHRHRSGRPEGPCPGCQVAAERLGGWGDTTTKGCEEHWRMTRGCTGAASAGADAAVGGAEEEHHTIVAAVHGKK